jgi:hypothetical protein
VTERALTLKQPWATLLANGLKTIEVRRWPTARRGRILIHASRIPDERAAAWVHVPRHLLEMARLTGGILGAGEIVDCVTYGTVEAFVADRPRHLNERSWYQSGLYGFLFTNLTTLHFRPYPGWMRFFPVTDENPVRP